MNQGLPSGLVVKNSATNAREIDLIDPIDQLIHRLIPRSGPFPGGGNGDTFQ